jgi:hypothetical protein
MAAKKAAKKPAAKKAAKSPAKRGSAVKSDVKDNSGSRQSRATRGVDASGSWPVDPSTGLPLAQISFTASELIPTGEYANVVVGPVTVTKFIPDPEDDDALAEALNDLAEVVEAKCISEQRELVLESLQVEAP